MIFFYLFNFHGATQNAYTLKNQEIEVSIDRFGNLITLKNHQSECNYASDKSIWRLYYDRSRYYGNEVSGKYLGYSGEQNPYLWKKASPMNYITTDDLPLSGKMKI